MLCNTSRCFLWTVINLMFGKTQYQCIKCSYLAKYGTTITYHSLQVYFFNVCLRNVRLIYIFLDTKTVTTYFTPKSGIRMFWIFEITDFFSSESFDIFFWHLVEGLGHIVIIISKKICFS
jgi:hypothetical protein